MIYIRHYTNEDFNMLTNWWLASGETPPPMDLLPVGSVYILELDNKPLLSGTIYFTNCEALCHIANLISNPEYKVENRKEYTEVLMKYLQKVAKNAGAKWALALPYKEGIKRIHLENGFRKTLDNITALVKDL